MIKSGNDDIVFAGFFYLIGNYFYFLLSFKNLQAI